VHGSVGGSDTLVLSESYHSSLVLHASFECRYWTVVLLLDPVKRKGAKAGEMAGSGGTGYSPRWQSKCRGMWTVW
jgi:hypothetical protein